MHTNPEVLALLALGEDDSASVDERVHVSSCSICTHEVAELAHLAGVGRAVQGAAPLSSPPPQVWDRIRTEIGFDTPKLKSLDGVAPPTPAVHSGAADLGHRSSDIESPGDRSADRSTGEVAGKPTDDLAREAQEHDAPEPRTVPAPAFGDRPDSGISDSGISDSGISDSGISDSGISDRDVPARPARRRRRGLAAVALAAAVALILGVGIGLGWTALSRPTPTVIGQAELTPGSENWAGSTGEAVLERDQAGKEILVVRMSTPRSSSGYRQVWMMNDAGAMVAVGIITGDEGEWTVPIDIETDFPVVDVSEEPLDGNLRHSGNTILRGTLNI